MKIRLLQRKDIPQAALIVGKNYSKKYQNLASKEMAAMFTKGENQPVYFCMENKGKVLGFAGYIQSWMDYDIYEIFWVNVLPQYQKQGIGKKLVAKIVTDIKNKKKNGLVVLSATVPNSKYYADHFKFKTVALFGKKHQNLMTLLI